MIDYQNTYRQGIMQLDGAEAACYAGLSELFTAAWQVSFGYIFQRPAD